MLSSLSHFVAAVCDRRCLVGKFPAVTDRRYKLLELMSVNRPSTTHVR